VQTRSDFCAQVPTKQDLSATSLAGVTVPVSVFIPGGSTVSPNFNVTTSPVATKQVGLVKATLGPSTVSRGLTINVGSGVCPPQLQRGTNHGAARDHVLMRLMKQTLLQLASGLKNRCSLEALFRLRKLRLFSMMRGTRIGGMPPRA
jgi:hypothetical protein